MVIIGAGGFAKEVLQIVSQTTAIEQIAFYDDVTVNGPDTLFDQFKILKNEDALVAHFEKFGPDFTLGLGGIRYRQLLYEKITNLGGNLASTIASQASIGIFSEIGPGCNILSHACISNASKIGKAALIYYNSNITHDCILGDFVEISPGATLLGRITIGDCTQVGANATILSDIKIGQNCLIGAGAVVTKDVPDNAVVVGIPARITRYQS